MGEESKKKKDQEKPSDLASLPESEGKSAESPDPGSYDPKGKIDPFEPLFKQEATGQEKRRKARTGPLTPLERVDLSQLKLVGVILASSGNKALIQEASGKGFVINNGTKIGINSGKVIQILKDRIIVEEEVEDIYGNLKMQKREMTLQKPPGD
ncbi:MAG: pilus assembly protein PilP [Thermodesulfobacteriota bacterium]